MNRNNQASQAKEWFSTDIATHKIEIIKDDGVHRHIRFQRPGTRCFMFELITWPGHLCYTGDMGTYVFSRLHDMFSFFRTKPESSSELHINPGYWSEKCVAANTNGSGLEEFSKELFDFNINEWVDEHANEHKPEDYETDRLALWEAAYAELREEVEWAIINADNNEVRCFDAANDFSHEGEAWVAFHGDGSSFQFTDFWEVDNKEYSFHYIWCCYAMAWGIKQYDAEVLERSLEMKP